MSFTGGYNLPSPIPQQGVPQVGGLSSPTQGSPPPWFGTPVQGSQGAMPPQQMQHPMAQQRPPMQMQQPQAPPPPQAPQQVPQTQQTTPYQRMMQGNGLQNFMQNATGANGGNNQMIRPNSLVGQIGALANGNTAGLNQNSLAGKLAQMFGGGGSLNGAAPQQIADASNASGVY